MLSALFRQHIKAAALNREQQRLDVSVFTTKLFAYYLHVRFVSFRECGQNYTRSLSIADVGKRHARNISEIPQLFIGDLLVFKSLNRAQERNVYNSPHVCCKLKCSKRDRSVFTETELNTSELVELLQKSAVEHLTTYRQRVAQDFDSVVTIVTEDFEALYAYKSGEYQRCLQLSTQNVQTLWYAHRMPDVPTLPEFIQLMDDDIVSLTALTMIVNPKSRAYTNGSFISQLTLSLYLMTQCQLKLRHSMTLLAKTLECIKIARNQKRYSNDISLSHFTLKLAERKIVMYLSTILNN